MEYNQEKDLKFEAVASIPKVTDCVGWDDQIATGHANSFIKLWKFDPVAKKMEFVLRFRHLSDSEDAEVFAEDAEEAPAKKKTYLESVSNMMLFHVDPQENPSNILDLLTEDENPIIQQIREILAAKTKTTTSFLCSFAGSDIQLWNKKGEGMFAYLPVDEAVIVGAELIAEVPESDGELGSESLLFGPPDSISALNANHAFGFFAAERSRQLWATSENGLSIHTDWVAEGTAIDINKVLTKKGISTGKEGWVSPSLCEWNKYVVVSGWEYGVHLWNTDSTLAAHLPEYHKGTPARKVFTWKGYLCVSVSAKGNDRIDFWKDGPLTKVGTWRLAGGNSDMEAKFFEWKGFLCALQYKNLTLYDCASLPEIMEDKIQLKPEVYTKGSGVEGESNNNNNNNKKKKKANKKKRPAATQENKKNPKKSKGTVDKLDEEDEYEDEFAEEEPSEEEPEPESSEYEDEEEDSD